jgi:soluble lytic murein transglycosylase-like protein
MTELRDPVQDLKRTVADAAYAQGQRHPTVAARLKWFLLGVVVGAVMMVWTAVAAAQTPLAAEQYRRDLTRVSQSIWGLVAPVSLLAAQIEQESGWRTRVVSSAGAGGLTQFMPATAEDVAARYGIGPANRFDPRWAMQAQSYYMRELFFAIEGADNASERMAFALAAYNGGMRWVERRRAMSAFPSLCIDASCDINPGITASNQRQNRDYSRRILMRLMPLYYLAGWGGPPLHLRYGGRS